MGDARSAHTSVKVQARCGLCTMVWCLAIVTSIFVSKSGSRH